MSENESKDNNVVQFKGDLKSVGNLETREDKQRFMTSIPPKQLQGVLKKLNVVTEVTADYLEISEGEVVRAIYMNQTTFRTTDDNGDEVRRPAVLLRNEKGNFISAGTVLVNALINLPDFTPVEIQNCGSKGQGTRKYTDYKVLLLSE